MRKILAIALFIVSFPSFAFSIGNANSGTRYLQISIAEDDQKTSEMFEVEEAFKSGGNVTINFQIASEMARKLNIKRITGHVRCSDNPKKTTCVPTFSYIINTVGAYEWNYHENLLGQIIFTKPFEDI